MSPEAENMLARMKSAGLPVPAPPNPGLEELVEAGLVTVSDGPPDVTLQLGQLEGRYPDDYRVWTLEP